MRQREQRQRETAREKEREGERPLERWTYISTKWLERQTGR